VFRWRLFHSISRKNGYEPADCAELAMLSPSKAAAINSKVRTGKRIEELPLVRLDCRSPILCDRFGER
jgi:hypothetical protein